ncbi:MAG: phosphotransferase enzyme family protein [Limnochordia bacterium]|jgi:Ser/Thr protein kinase RdoA (MazF antagonist)
MEAAILRVLSNWNIGEVTSVETFHSGKYRSSGNAYLVRCEGSLFVLKRVKPKDTLGQMFAVLPELYRRGVPVAVPVATRDGKQAVFCDEDCYYVAPFLYGSVINDHFGPGIERRSRSFGKALARLHVALRQIDLPGRLTKIDLPGQVQACEEKARTGGMSPSVTAALSETIDAFRSSSPLPNQLIHRDAHASNVLFTDNEVSGWLDFELMTIGPRAFDLGYYSTSLLMDALDDPAKTERWLSALGPLVGGYQAGDGLTDNECALLPYVLLAIEAVFLSYYFRINDQAGIRENARALEWIHGNLCAVREAMFG